jgi:methionine-rich copper-binding protein CopC
MLVLTCAGALLAPVAAQAHAHLDHAQPAADSTVKTPPKDVTLWFTEAVEPKFSSVDVRDAKGSSVNDGAAQAVAGNTAELRVMLKPLAAGTYTVEWRALSVDTHRTHGTFSFTVAP